jgi:hypothetical protein
MPYDSSARSSVGGLARDPAQRERYLAVALAEIPRLLGAIDRNPFRPTYGSLDREYWHYRTSSFPSEMYQEGALPLALVYATRLPGNGWHQNPRVKELAVAAIRFAARASHADGSCDDYYPFERALGAAVFSLQACARAYQLLDLDDAQLLSWFRRRADWLLAHEESGHLANHHALAALGLVRMAQITGDRQYGQAAEATIEKLLGWQSDEGWFEEYGGADPGYQTVTIDCLAKIRQLTGSPRLDEPLRRAVAFARLFLHPDGSYAGEYGSRGTYHFYPHGMELLAATDPAAADLADGFLRSLAAGVQGHFGDDRMYAHRLGNLLEAYVDWSPTRPAPEVEQGPVVTYLSGAQLLVRRDAQEHTVVSAARGGVFKHFAAGHEPVTDAGLIVETTEGRLAVSQSHGLARAIEVALPQSSPGESEGYVSVAGPLHWCRFETVTPWKQAILHLGMWLAGRWCRTLVRWLLQRRLITGRRECPVRLTRRFEFLRPEAGKGCSLRVTDTIELTSPTVQIRRMAFGTDHQAAYVAASGVYQPSVLRPWTDLAEHVPTLNAKRRVVVVREF